MAGFQFLFPERLSRLTFQRSEGLIHVISSCHDMSASEDEYDAHLGGAIKLSAEDCANIDALCSTASLGSRTAHQSIASGDEHVAQLNGAIKLPDDYAKIDELCSNASFGSVTPRTTHIPVELETPICPDTKHSTTRLPVTSPFQSYRSWGRLSVTDLVAPTWQVYFKSP